MEDKEVEDQFTRMVSNGWRKPKLVVKIEISKDGDLYKGIERQNVLHFYYKLNSQNNYNK